MTVDPVVTETVHAPVPVQAPRQPPKVEPAVGEAVSVTSVPGATDALQELPQSMPAGDDVTDPDPLPIRVTPRQA